MWKVLGCKFTTPMAISGTKIIEKSRLLFRERGSSFSAEKGDRFLQLKVK